MKAMDVGQRPESEIQQKNHVERAIIMAAGTGTRMRPVTLTTPKPLIRVKGVRMIDTVIQALHENGIYEIYVVVGYRKEQFACLTAEYKGVTLIDNAVWTDEKTDEWLMQVKDGIVCSCSRTGGKGGWQLFSVSRWNREDGKRLKRHLELEFEKKQNRQIYWDDVAMFCHFQEYELGIYPMQKGDLIEIDDFSELCELDPSYCGYEAQGQEKSEEK